MALLDYLWVILITIIPGIELRGSIPAGAALQLDPYTVFLAAVLTNIAIIPIIFIVLDKFWLKLAKYKICRKTMERIWNRTHRRVRKHGYIALTLFVAIPLPVTGAYTGSLIAWLLEMDRKKAFVAIAAGVIIAGVLVTLIVMGLLHAISWMV
jgi:uncharacterized membrane protein